MRSDEDRLAGHRVDEIVDIRRLGEPTVHAQWEMRAKEKGLVYTERLYRELYHLYDFENKWHVTEVQIEVE